MPSTKKCPHCGKTFKTPGAADEPTPTHDYPPITRAVCPGSGQPLIAAHDPRALGKDDR